MSDAVTVRPAAAADVEQIYAFIVELAEYERARDQVAGTAELLARRAVRRAPVGRGAGRPRSTAQPAGFALVSRHLLDLGVPAGLWLEDLYVPPAHRRAGVGRRPAAPRWPRSPWQRGCPRLEWNALDWNDPALGFYARLGAQRLSEWELHRLDGDALARVAAGRP